MNQNMQPGKQLIEQFKQFYQDVKQPQLDKIADLYADHILFKDPVHQLRGIESVHAYLSSMCVNVTSGHFEYLDQVIGENTAYIKWNMHFRHKSLGDKLVTVRGMTQVQFNERVYFHEDVYDLGEMLYEQVPLLGGVVRKLKKRLAS